MFKLSQTYLYNGEPVVYRGEQGAQYVFEYVNQVGYINLLPEHLNTISDVPKAK